MVDEEIYEIDDACDVLLDYGDVDYFSAEKCIKLRDWLSDRLKKPGDKELLEFYKDLLSMAIRAIELNTGIVIEL